MRFNILTKIDNIILLLFVIIAIWLIVRLIMLRYSEEHLTINETDYKMSDLQVISNKLRDNEFSVDDLTVTNKLINDKLEISNSNLKTEGSVNLIGEDSKICFTDDKQNSQCLDKNDMLPLFDFNTFIKNDLLKKKINSQSWANKKVIGKMIDKNTGKTFDFGVGYYTSLREISAYKSDGSPKTYSGTHNFFIVNPNILDELFSPVNRNEANNLYQVNPNYCTFKSIGNDSYFFDHKITHISLAPGYQITLYNRSWNKGQEAFKKIILNDTEDVIEIDVSNKETGFYVGNSVRGISAFIVEYGMNEDITKDIKWKSEGNYGYD